MIEINKIYNQDCLIGMSNIDDCSIDLIVTSPPYNKSFFNKNKKVGNSIWKGFSINYDTYDDNMELDEYEEWICKILKECYRILKPGGSIFFNHKPIRHDNEIYHPMRLILKSELPLYQEIIWNRKNSPNIRKDILMPNTERIYWIGKGKPNFDKNSLSNDFKSEIWTITPKADKEHPAPFPIELVNNCIKCCCPENGIVLDPFMGSGTTAISAVINNRNYVGFEISEGYYELANRRIKEVKEEIESSLFK